MVVLASTGSTPEVVVWPVVRYARNPECDKRGIGNLTSAQHHHRTNIDKYHPGYFGKVGMRYFHKLQNQLYVPAILAAKNSILMNCAAGSPL